jgi:LysR family transcriptional regulator, glycine cleavage system transcriptional activator
MRRLPALGSLRAFEAAARHESFKHAASELSVTPTAISHQIRQLEAEIGRPLFLRQTRSVTLTAEGDAFFVPLRQAFDSMADAVSAIKRRPARRVATLSATTAFTARLLVPRVSGFRNLHANWDLRLQAVDQPANLEAGEADAAIRYGLGRYPGLTTVPLLVDQFAPVCSPRLGLRSIDDLSEVALIHFEWRFATAKRALPCWRLWAAKSGLATVDADSGITFSDENAAIQAAIAGQGVALLSLTLVASELASGALIQPFGPTLEGRRYDLVYPVGAESRPAVDALRRWLAGVFTETPGH